MLVERAVAPSRLACQLGSPRIVPYSKNDTGSPPSDNDIAGVCCSELQLTVPSPGHLLHDESQKCVVPGDDQAKGSAPMPATEGQTSTGPTTQRPAPSTEKHEILSILPTEEDTMPITALRELSRGSPGAIKSADAACAHFQRERTLRRPSFNAPKVSVRPAVPSNGDAEARCLMNGFAKLPELPTIASPLEKQGRRRKVDWRKQLRWEEKRANSECADVFLDEMWSDVPAESSPPLLENPSFIPSIERAATDGFASLYTPLIPAPRHSLRPQPRFTRLGPHPSASNANAHSTLAAIGDAENEVHHSSDDVSDEEVIPEEGALALASSSPSRFAWSGKRPEMKIPDTPVIDLESTDDQEFELGDRISEVPTSSKRGLWTDWDYGSTSDEPLVCGTGKEKQILSSFDLPDDLFDLVHRGAYDKSTYDTMRSVSDTISRKPETFAFEVDQRMLIISL